MLHHPLAAIAAAAAAGLALVIWAAAEIRRISPEQRRRMANPTIPWGWENWR